MIDSKGLAAFSAIVKNASFERAAAELFITQSAVSQRLKQLEQNVGHSLVVRSPQIKATIAGQALLKYAHNLSQIERDLIGELAPKKQLDWLKISIATNADTLATWLLGALAPWCSEHKILLDLKVDDQDETHQGKITGTRLDRRGRIIRARSTQARRRSIACDGFNGQVQPPGGQPADQRPRAGRV